MAGTSTINAAAPYTAGSGLAIQVTNANGVSNTNVTLTINPVPVVTGVSPNAGFETNTVTVYGYNLSSSSAVYFGGVAASIGGSSATSITVSVPTSSNPANQTTVDVTVAANGYTSATSSADGFTYFARPVVSSVSPGSGYNGDTITVYFTTSNSWTYNWVQIGGTTVLGYGNTNGSYIQFTAPIPYAVGWGGGNEGININITQGGQSATISLGNFDYYGESTPSISSVSDYGNGWILVNGSYFSNVTGANIDGSAVSYSKLSDTQVQVQVPSSDIALSTTVQLANTIGWGGNYGWTYGQEVALLWNGTNNSTYATGGINDSCFSNSSDPWWGLTGHFSPWSFNNSVGGNVGGTAGNSCNVYLNATDNQASSFYQDINLTVNQGQYYVFELDVDDNGSQTIAIYLGNGKGSSSGGGASTSSGAYANWQTYTTKIQAGSGDSWIRVQMYTGGAANYYVTYGTLSSWNP